MRALWGLPARRLRARGYSTRVCNSWPQAEQDIASAAMLGRRRGLLTATSFEIDPNLRQLPLPARSLACRIARQLLFVSHGFSGIEAGPVSSTRAAYREARRFFAHPAQSCIFLRGLHVASLLVMTAAITNATPNNTEPTDVRTMPKTKHVTLYILYLSLIVLIASACGDDDVTQLRLIHASPDSPAVDVYIAGDSTPLFEDISYGETSEYRSIDSGIADFEIRPAGAPSDSEPVFTQEDIILVTDGKLTGVIAGLTGSSAPGDRARLELFSETFDPAQPDVARVRLIHASPDAPTLAVDVNDDGTREIGELVRFASTEEAGIEVPADMPLNIGLWAGEPLERITTFTIPALAEGEEIFVVASGQIERMPREEAGFSLLVVGPSGAPIIVKQNPALMALHGLPDAQAIDIYDGNETLLAANVTFGSLSEPILLRAGELELNLIESGQPATATPLATFTTPALEPGNRYLGTASGLLKVPGREIQLIVDAEDFAVDDSSDAQFAFLHASPDAPAIDISTVVAGLLTPPALVNSLDFGKVFPSEGSVSLPPATYSMGIAPATIREPIATFELQATAGMREFAIILGMLFPGDNEPLVIFLIDTKVFPWTVSPIPLMMVVGA